MAYDVMSVQNEQYCVPSMNKRNVDEMSTKMGYHDMSDRANTKPWPTSMQGATRNTQEMNPTNGAGSPSGRGKD